MGVDQWHCGHSNASAQNDNCSMGKVECVALFQQGFDIEQVQLDADDEEEQESNRPKLVCSPSNSVRGDET